jgi:Uma2 family endonuclease
MTMMYATDASPIPRPPPGENELPYDDGEPMETGRHRRQMDLSIESLEGHWVDRDDMAIEGNMALYFSELQAKKNDFRAPDIFVVLDTVRRDRKSWVVWQEERTPNVVIELLSPSTEAADRGDKMRIYAKLLRVPEYFLFDPLTGALEGYRLDLDTLSYIPMTQEPTGEYLSRQLRLRLGVRPGRFQGIEADWLRWIDLEGRVLPSSEERAAEAEQEATEAQQKAAQAEQKATQAEREAIEAQQKATQAEREATEAQQKATQAEQKATQAEQKAQDLAEKLAEYEKRFGKLSGAG